MTARSSARRETSSGRFAKAGLSEHGTPSAPFGRTSTKAQEDLPLIAFENVSFSYMGAAADKQRRRRGAAQAAAADAAKSIHPIAIPEGDSADKGNFSKALKSLLRHDPDVVMIGEIRDADSLDAAVKAALTGHLVLSTLHTNDAKSTVTRL